MESRNISKATLDVGIALKNTLKSLYRLAPTAVLVLFILAVSFVYIVSQNATLYVLTTSILVIIVSIIVYSSSKNFGESALALVAGLLAVFSVDWDRGAFIIFSLSWVVFTLTTLTLASVRIAMVLESSLRQAALRINPSTYKKK